MGAGLSWPSCAMAFGNLVAHESCLTQLLRLVEVECRKRVVATTTGMKRTATKKTGVNKQKQSVYFEERPAFVSAV